MSDTSAADSMIERMALAFLEGLRGAPAYVGEAGDLRGVTLDGDFDLIAAMRAALAVMREPTEAMYLARPVSIPERSDWLRIWQWQIDAILGEQP